VDAEAARPVPGRDGLDPVPAATVVLLRDGVDGVETLMLRRNTALDFAGGAWVFPGGRVDPGDLDPERPTDALAAARNAAAREAREEADVELDPESFVVLSRWCPPPEAPKRFDTWFFVGRAPFEIEITIDGSEIHEHTWARPADVLARRATGDIELFPPTWVSLHQLTRYEDVDTALAGIAATKPHYFVTRVAKQPDGTRTVMWDPDAGYRSGNLDAVGPRHRLIMWPDGWEYLRT
jgi:8-oxo-dGTP pyrophosphatase MutT (NUDIX family)